MFQGWSNNVQWLLVFGFPLSFIPKFPGRKSEEPDWAAGGIIIEEKFPVMSNFLSHTHSITHTINHTKEKSITLPGTVEFCSHSFLKFTAEPTWRCRTAPLSRRSSKPPEWTSGRVASVGVASWPPPGCPSARWQCAAAVRGCTSRRSPASWSGRCHTGTWSDRRERACKVKTKSRLFCHLEPWAVRWTYFSTRPRMFSFSKCHRLLAKYEMTVANLCTFRYRSMMLKLKIIVIIN